VATFHKDDGPWTNLIYENEDYYIFYCGFPVTPGHRLYVPKTDSTFIIGQCFESAIKQGRKLVHTGEIDGFNVGMNHGEAAGQTITWPHVHLIYRYKGDVEDPTGGVRNVIPSQGNYRGDTYVQPAVRSESS
jgi:diadenosine tetraphosphate (Ap4A) HIT family hydrolase